MSALLKAKASDQPEVLAKLRHEIDQVDTNLVALLKKRAELVFAVGDYKRERQLPIFDPSRESLIRDRIRSLALPGETLSPNELESLFMALVERYRFFEGPHVQRTQATSLFNDSHITFNKPQRVVLWGFGLMGASFYLGLNQVLPHWKFEVVDPVLDRTSFANWVAQKNVSNIELISPTAMHQATIYILAASVEQNEHHLHEYSFPEDSLVFDLGSTKSSTESIFNQRQKRGKTPFIYVGGHPLAGKETNGFENADTMLFYNKVFCWTVPENQPINRKVKATCDTLSMCLGAKPFWTTAADHDQALAWTSHLPQIISSTLATCLSEKDFSEKPELFPGSVSELLRLSGSSVSMWKPIIKSNNGPLKKALQEIIERLTFIKNQLDKPTETDGLFSKANSFYKKFNLLKK